MGNILRRLGSETYPSSNAGGAAVSAFTNRNVAGFNALSVPFTPNNSLIAAILFTPRVSGVIQASASLLIQNGAAADTYAAVMEAVPGTGLSVSGGEVTENGWVMGSNTPPVFGGVTGAPAMAMESFTILGSGDSGSFLTYGISPPLAVGVPVLVLVLITETGGGHDLSQLVFSNLSVLEMP